MYVSFLSIHSLRERVASEHCDIKQKELDTMPKASHGYGGKFGLQQDRMDKVRLERAYTEPRHELLQMKSDSEVS